jgi:hypothetical protein
VSSICECPALPVNIWFRRGEEIERRELAEDTGDRDADDYLALKCDSWIITCPECGLIMAAGQTGA